MGSSDERNRKAIDASVGGLVWVRRRNGSWWPGRIMGIDEVPESSLASPKAGTPIKLLGRDDASVDWYNLEKSKRVKAFRCGEYDACIEKAKTAAANSCKKAVKYARREDAILHALEIESVHLGKDSFETHMQKENSCNEEAPKISLSSKGNGNTGDTRDSEDESDSTPELLQSGISFEEPSHINVSKVLALSEKRRRTPNDSEDDGTEGIKRMRGLEDLGMGVGSKGKGLLEQVKQESALPSDVKPNGSLPNGGLATATKVCASSLKRKRSQVSNFNESSKRKNRRRPLTKVLESTAMVSVPITCDQFGGPDGSPIRGFSESKVSGLESNESMKSLYAVVNNNSDSTGVSSENAVSLIPSENVCEAFHNKAKDSEISSISILAENDSSNRLFDVPLVEEEKDYAGFGSMFTSYSPSRALVTGLGRQSDQGNLAEAVVETEVLNETGRIPFSAANVNGNIRGIEKSASEWQSKGKRNSRQMSRKQDHRKHVDTDEPNNVLPQGTLSVQKPNPHFSLNSPYGMHDFPGSSSLYDVNIEVKASYKPRNVPLVSLMSKLNGKAIVGHPLTVEVLEDGFCNHMVNNMDYNPTDVPIVAAYDLDQALKPTSRKPVKRMTPKSHLPPRKSSKSKKSRKTASLSKKTRRLSSLTNLKPSERGKKLALEKQKEPVVACIPLKLVFSRINEAMNGSARQAPRSLPSAANT